MATSNLSKSKSNLSKSKTTTDYESLLASAEAQGKTTSKVGAMTRLINVLSSFEPGGELTTYVRKTKAGASGAEAAATAGKQYVSELARGLGSALPFLDRFTKPEDLRSTQEGYASLLQELGVPETPITIAGKRLGSVRGAAGLAGDVFLDPGNLLLAGVFKTAAKGAGAVAKGGGKVLSKFPLGQKVLKTGAEISEVAKEALIPAYKANKVAPELVERVTKSVKSGNIGVRKALQSMGDIQAKFGNDAIDLARNELEGNILLRSKGKPVTKLTEGTQEVVNLIKRVTQGEIGLKIRDKDILDYFPRKVVSDRGNYYLPGVGRVKPSIGGFNKGRHYLTLVDGSESGVKYEGAVDALFARLRMSVRAQEAKPILNELVGMQIRGVDGTPLIKRIAKGKDLDPGNVPVIIDKTGFHSGKDLLRFYPTYDDAGKKLIAVTKQKAIYQMPKDAADYMAKVNRVFGDDEATRGVLRLYDKVLNLWKGSVTSYFPAFHFRNEIGNIFNNWVAGVNNPFDYFKAKDLMKGTGELTPEFKKIFPQAKTFEEARDLLGKIGVTSQGQFSVESGGSAEKLLTDLVPGLTFAKAANAPRAAGTFLEDNARIAHFLNKLGKGETVGDAAKSVNKFLFDYSDLSNFEREVMKRIFPFYTFTRKNIPLQIEQIFKQPVKYAKLTDALEALRTGDLTPDEEKYMPDYIKDTLGISFGKSAEGMPQILAGLNLPLEDLSKLGTPLTAAVGMVHPLAKAPFELASGTSFFYGKPIKDTSSYNATTNFIGSIPGLKQYLKAEPAISKTGTKYYRVDPERMYVLKSLLGRFVTTGEKLTDARKNLLTNAITGLTGVKVYAPDIDKEKERQIIEMLKELGLVKTFSKDYVPKK